MREAARVRVAGPTIIFACDVRPALCENDRVGLRPLCLLAAMGSCVLPGSPLWHEWRPVSCAPTCVLHNLLANPHIIYRCGVILRNRPRAARLACRAE